MPVSRSVFSAGFAVVVLTLLPLPRRRDPRRRCRSTPTTRAFPGLPCRPPTFLGGDIVNRLKAEQRVSVAPVVTQFGWQFERQFYRGPNGPTAVTEAVFLVSGLEQGVALPSLSWLVGVRAKNGAEFGVRPEHHPGGRGARHRRRRDVPCGNPQCAGESGGGAVEGRRPGQRAHRVQLAAAMEMMYPLSRIYGLNDWPRTRHPRSPGRRCPIRTRSRILLPSSIATS